MGNSGQIMNSKINAYLRLLNDLIISVYFCLALGVLVYGLLNV